MREWETLVRERLGVLGVPVSREPEIVRELADHLEDFWAELHGRSATREEAAAMAGREDWRGLRRGLRSALSEEGDMSERVRRYFVPALAMQVLATAVLVGIQQAGVEPHVILVQGVVSGGFLFYIPWLLALPIIGALRGLWGRTQGEHGGTIVLGAAVPVLVIGGLLATASLLGVVEHAVQGHSLGWWYVKAVGTMLVTWFVVPGLAMLAGAVPFAIQSRAQRAIA